MKIPDEEIARRISMNEPIILRLEVESFRERIFHAFVTREDEIQEMFRKAVDETVTSAAIEEAILDRVKQELKLAIQTAIKRYFSWNDEGYRVVDKAVRVALCEVLKQESEDTNETS